MNVSKILQGASLAAALAATGAVLVWAPVCSGSLELANGNMVPMRCFYAGKEGLLLAVLLAVACVAELATKRMFTVVVVALSMALVLVTFAGPVSEGVCANADMACQATAWWFRGCGALSAVAALGAYAVNPARKRVQNI